jgi:hypothetical protein
MMGAIWILVQYAYCVVQYEYCTFFCAIWFLILNPSDLEEIDLNGHLSSNTSFVNKNTLHAGALGELPPKRRRQLTQQCRL